MNTHPPSTPEVMAALDHVISHYPSVGLVVFNGDTRWCYMDEVFNSPTFGPEIDVAILEAAADSLSSFPCVFEIVTL